jgi:GAF domain-containing protein
MGAPIPHDEERRLEALWSLRILDTQSEPAWDRVTRLVSMILGVPIALVSLVDKERQWFKSRVGLEAQETPRDVSFCAHAICDMNPLVVEDATKDERFRENPLVRSDPYIRFYAGVPIRTAAGLAVGTLCAIDRRPRKLDPEKLEILNELAEAISEQLRLKDALAAADIELRRSHEALKASETQYRSMFELASIGMALIGADGYWLSANGAFSRLVGFNVEELKHLRTNELTHPEDLDVEILPLGRLINNEIENYQLEKRYIHKD